MASFQPIPWIQVSDDAGAPLAGGKVWTYISGTTTAKATYTDAALITPNTNPIILNARGEAQMVLGAGAYSLKLLRADDTLVKTIDGVTDVPAAATANLAASTGAGLVGFHSSTGRTVEQQLDMLYFGITDITDPQFAGGADKTGVASSTAAILAALTFLKPTGGILRIPRGTFLTASIDLRGFNNLTIIGDNKSSEFQYTPTSVIKISSACAIGVQMSDTGLEVPVNVGKGITIDGIFLDANNLATTGMNMNLSVKVRNTCVRRAINDGIMFEGQTYPVALEHVVSQYNGRHGLYVKAPNTTVYSITNCEFGFNTGYGMYIEDGSTCVFNNVLCQSNSRGGVRIIQQNPTLFTKPIFIERPLFIGLYLENNGLLAGGDPAFDGNFGIKIDGFNQDPATGVGKINDITFINCVPNKSVGGAYAQIRGTSGVNLTGTPFLAAAIDPLYNQITLPTVNGIKFPAVQVPSTDVNVLDDYKEGAFTFSLAQGGTAPLFTQSGAPINRYVKNGREVTCYFDYSWSSQNGANAVFNAKVAGLPYPVIGGVYQAATPIEMIVAGGSLDRWAIYPDPATSTCFLSKNGSDVFALCGGLPASGRVTGVFKYWAAA